MKQTLVLVIVILSFLHQSCRNKDKEAVGNGTLNDVFFDVIINAEEGDDKLSVLVRFKDEEQSDFVQLSNSVFITLDSELMQPDSSKMMGTFYESYYPIEQFNGNHILLLKEDENEFQSAFSFESFALLTPVSDTIRREDWQLTFSGLGAFDRVRLLATDTSFESQGINREAFLVNNQLMVNKAELFNLKSGPVFLELIRETEFPLNKLSSKRGKMTMTFRIRRQFILVD